MMWRETGGRYGTGMVMVTAFTTGYPTDPEELQDRIEYDFSLLGLPHVFSVEKNVSLNILLTERKMTFERWANIRIQDRTYFAFSNEKDYVVARILV